MEAIKSKFTEDWNKSFNKFDPVGLDLALNCIQHCTYNYGTHILFKFMGSIYKVDKILNHKAILKKFQGL